MENVKEKAFEYISEQLKIFVINRLAQSPSTSQQLATSFSILVDDLTVTVASIDHILDALVKAHIVEIDDVNGIRMNYLMRFDGDNIFELDLEAVERLIVENDIPYYENVIPTDQDDLYFEYVDDKICIHLNRPIEISELPPIESPQEEGDSIENDGENIPYNEDTEINLSSNEDTDNELSIGENEAEIDIENELVNNNQLDIVDSFDDEESSIDEPILSEQSDKITIDSTVSQTTPEAGDNVDESSLPIEDQEPDIENEENELDQSLLKQEPEIVNENLKENLDDTCPTPEEDKIDLEISEKSEESVAIKDESLSDVSHQIDTEKLKKEISEDIDFSSPLEPISYAEPVNTSDDFFNDYFANYLPKKSEEKAQDEPIVESTKEEIIKDNSKTEGDISTIPEEMSKVNNTESLENIGDNIVFTTDVYTQTSTLTPEEESKRIEEALRKLNEFSKPKEKKEEVPVSPVENKKEDEIEFFDVSINDLINESKTAPEEVTDDNEIVEEDKKASSFISVKAYIEEQDLINSYDWEKKLSRVFVDLDNDDGEYSPSSDNNVVVSTYSELKDIMEKKNYKFKAYSNYDSVSFYSQNYIFSNRLNKSTAIYTYLFMLIEIIVGYLFVDKYINRGLTPYLILAIGLMVIPVVFYLKYVYFKDKRKPANFRFSISIVTALMVYVNLMVMIVLFAFFVPSLNVSINDLSSMITTIFYPAGLLLAIPFSVCVYSILYSSKKYHLH